MVRAGLGTLLGLIVLTLAACGGERHVSAAEFHHYYDQIGLLQTMRQVDYLDRHEGRAHLRVRSISATGGEWSEELLYVGLDELDPAFRTTLPAGDYTP